MENSRATNQNIHQELKAIIQEARVCLEQVRRTLERNKGMIVAGEQIKFQVAEAKTSLKNASLKEALVSGIQEFVLNQGKGFAFVARNKYIRTDGHRFKIDLVFYHYQLKRFVLIHLTSGNLSPSELDKWRDRLRSFEAIQHPQEENPSLGMLIHRYKNQPQLRYFTSDKDDELWAINFNSHLEEELEQELLRIKAQYEGKLSKGISQSKNSNKSALRRKHRLENNSL